MKYLISWSLLSLGLGRVPQQAATNSPGRSLLPGGEGPGGHGHHHPRKNPQWRTMLLILRLVIIYLTEKSYFLRFLVCLYLDSLPVVSFLSFPGAAWIPQGRYRQPNSDSNPSPPPVFCAP